jgi:hypothetical protein
VASQQNGWLVDLIALKISTRAYTNVDSQSATIHLAVAATNERIVG